MGRFWVGACLVLVVAACGGGELSLSEYGAQAEDLVTAMQARIDALDAEWESQVPTVEGARVYWESRIDARVALLEGLEALVPPKEAVELNAAAVDLFAQLTAAEEALAARAATVEVLSDHGPWWDTAEGRAAQTADAAMIEICNVVQAEFDKTRERDITADVPWLPSDLKEIVEVAFGCPP